MQATQLQCNTIRHKRAKAKSQKDTNKKKLDSADLELCLPEADDTSSLCDSNQPLRIQYKQMLLVRLQMTATK